MLDKNIKLCYDNIGNAEWCSGSILGSEPRGLGSNPGSASNGAGVI